jgi:uncharacterized membrane protein YphA (DoxX/SURF4 family)
MKQELAKTIALVRILTGGIFFLFGEYKVAGPGFAHGGFQQYLAEYISTDALSFYRPVLVHIVLPHAVALGYLVGVLELAIAASLILGIWVRPMSVIGALYMLNLIFSTWNAPGPGVVWRYFGAELDHIPLLFLFAIFYTARAGETWGLDGRGFRLRTQKASA